MPYSALIDASTSALLALSTHAYVVSFLAKSQPLEAEQAHGVNWPNYYKSFPLEKADYRTYPNWTWDQNTRLFSPTAENLVTSDLRQRSDLAVRKSAVLREIIYELSVTRYTVWKGPLMQEAIYLTKKMEAEKFRDAGYPEDKILSYPYVLQYADFAGFTMREAADEILFKARLDDEFLAKTELLRLRYFNSIRNAATSDDITRVLTEFRREIYGKRLI